MTDRTHTVLDGHATNTKGHSFLQHFPLFVLPGPVTEAFPTLVPALLEEISEQLRVLFFDGITSPRAAGRTFNVACIGHKGDLKWFTIVGCLAHSYERRGSTYPAVTSAWAAALVELNGKIFLKIPYGQGQF